MTSQITKRILILDDEETRTMLAALLADKGYQIVQAKNGPEAISLHWQNPFDLAIIELLMNSDDGFKVLVELRRTASPPKFIAIAKASRTPPEIYLKIASQLGAHATLARPFTSDQLSAVVQNVLDTNV